ncbi:hypothetical protein ACIOHE_23755 [Streptomyces sp. NPDC087851]|uniref:hypothetical protein n=1 Tax=Streptomyces sp. NPDC087851 TaxID=3365810 RepID=UPI00381B431F
MTRPTPYPVRLADEIARQLGQLTDHLSHLPPAEATQVIARVLGSDEDGVLDRVTHLMATSSVVAKAQAENGVLPPEAALALARAANDVHDVHLDLDEHLETLRDFSTGAAGPAVKPPTPAPLVVRRHR